MIGVALADSGGGKGKSGDKGGGKGHADRGAAKTATTAPRTSGSAASGSPLRVRRDAVRRLGRHARGRRPAPGAALPAGWTTFRDHEGFSIALPPGWKRVGDNGFGGGSRFSGSGGANLLVDWTHSPGRSALGTWRKDAASQGPTMDAYHQIEVAAVHYRDYDAADWEYTRREQGKPVHVLNRGMVTDPGHGYALMYTAPAGQWSSAADRLARTTFFTTFKPAK